MTQEDKQLLLKDLCARLPYVTQIHITSDECDDGFQSGEFDNTLRYHHIEAFVCDRIEIRPYLRPLSSMTEEEKELYKSFAVAFGDSRDIMLPGYAAMDWLNGNHFDYRGLIPMGIALEAPMDMYKTK